MLGTKHVRVQSLSPCLLRIEPSSSDQGAVYFENRTTFMVQQRPSNGPVLTVYNNTGKVAWLGTDNLLLELVANGNGSTGIAATVFNNVKHTLLWTTSDLSFVDNQLWWPDPLVSSSYALQDFPRFHVPAWAATPPSPGSHVDPSLVNTTGYDFRFNTPGDTYVFFFEARPGIDGWYDARRDFLSLTGPTPELPDWAFGIWFTFFHNYKEDEAKNEIERWQTDQLPLAVWGTS